MCRCMYKSKTLTQCQYHVELYIDHMWNWQTPISDINLSDDDALRNQGAQGIAMKKECLTCAKAISVLYFAYIDTVLQ